MSTGSLVRLSKFDAVRAKVDLRYGSNILVIACRSLAVAVKLSVTSTSRKTNLRERRAKVGKTEQDRT